EIGQFRELSDLVTFLESQIVTALPVRRVKIILDSDEVARNETGKEPEQTPLATDFDQSIPLRRENRRIGQLLIEAGPSTLPPDVPAVLEVLDGQIAIAIEDCRLVEENVRLERKVAEGERLAALGQMAATVAHEVKNPLSAIKSIAQVMSEDEALKTQHARDLNLIVGETDRLSKSVSQLLSFASKQPPSAPPSRAGELVRSVVDLFRADAAERNVTLHCSAGTNAALDGVQTAAVRDALSNLVPNALQ